MHSSSRVRLYKKVTTVTVVVGTILKEDNEDGCVPFAERFDGARSRAKCLPPCLEVHGSWVVISGVISRVTAMIMMGSSLRPSSPRIIYILAVIFGIGLCGILYHKYNQEPTK